MCEVPCQWYCQLNFVIPVFFPIFTLMSRFLLFLLLMVSGKPLFAQTLSLDLHYFNDYLRDQQLLGKVDSGISWMVKPLHLQHTLGNGRVFTNDSSWWPNTEHAFKTGGHSKNEKGLHLQLLPLHLRTQFNTIHNYGWQNGSMVPNRGWQSFFSGGLLVRYNKWVELQLRPEYIRANNKVYSSPPVRHRGIDMPERMGTAPIREWYAGQSYLKFHWKGISAGLSTENLQWGPARQGSIFLSPSAPGFAHFTLHTNKPWKTRIGNFEGQFVGGRLRYSGFFPYGTEWVENTEPPFEPVRAAEITPSPLGSGEHSKVSMITAAYMPKWVRGLFIGGAYGVQSTNAPWPVGLFAIFNPGTERTNIGNPYTQNGVLSLFARYLLPAVNMEIYGELGREDWFRDLQDLATDPAHTTVYLWGINKLFPLAGKAHYLRFETEFTQLMPPITQLSRAPGYGFYTHANGVGWTHRGQNLGVGLPPGSNRQQIGVLWNKGYHRLGLSFERIEYAQDLYYFRMPFLLNPAIGNPLAMDYSKRFVDLVGKLRMQTAYKGLIVGADAMVLRTLNFQWVYVPNGRSDGFRFPGYNYWSVNAHLYAYYRF